MLEKSIFCWLRITVMKYFRNFDDRCFNWLYPLEVNFKNVVFEQLGLPLNTKLYSFNDKTTFTDQIRSCDRQILLFFWVNEVDYFIYFKVSLKQKMSGPVNLKPFMVMLLLARVGVMPFKFPRF